MTTFNTSNVAQLGSAFVPVSHSDAVQMGAVSSMPYSMGARKRKDMDTESDEECSSRPDFSRKISRSRAPIHYDSNESLSLSFKTSPTTGMAQLYAHHAGLPAADLPPTPETSPSRGYFGLPSPPATDASSSSPGLMGPTNTVNDGDMQIDGAPSHGAHCRSIPQLFVRHIVQEGTGSYSGTELWARCADCGTASKVETPREKSEAMAHSP